MLHANDSFNSKLVELEELVGLSSHSTGALSGCIKTPLELMVTVGDNTQVLVSSLPDRLFQLFLFYKFVSPALPGIVQLSGPSVDV